jgi:Ca-activated chloride channel family protein
MRTLRPAVCLLALIALPTGLSRLRMPAFAQDSAQITADGNPRRQIQGAATKDYSLKIDVGLVTVDAIVRDKQGAVVGDLRPQDFLVYDNGVAQTISHFSRDQLPLAVALLIDRSPSIGRYLRDLQSAGLSALGRLKPEDQVVLFSFDQCPTRLSDLTEDRAQLAEKINGIRIGSSTNIYDAIFEAARFLREKAPDRRRAIILISDNYSTVFPMTERDVLTESLEASATLFSIRTPGDNGNSGDPDSIERIAKDTGGEVLKLGNSEKLSAALDRAIANLRMGYTLGFAPVKSGEDHSFHKLTVKLNPALSCPGCRLQARSGYFTGSQTAAQAGVTIGIVTPPYNCEEFLAESEATQRILEAGGTLSDYRQVSLKVDTQTSTDARGKPQIEVSMHIGPAGIRYHTIDNLHVGRLDVAVFYGDAKMKYLGEEWQTADLQLQEEDYQKALQSGVSVIVTVPYKTPGEVLKIVACDVWSGRVASKSIRMK